ncbi:MAG: T9SS C-terminal target domain-containing protein [Calditrichaeota bacterium]|nr:MAG: T9SS C-terminal target domain-containing protein [Calditrichota bacterium]
MKNLTKTLLTLSLGLTFATNASAQKMYIADGTANNIKRSDLDGSNISTLVSAGVTNPYSIDVGITISKIYWGDIDDDNIKRSDLDGSNVETIVTTTELATGMGTIVDFAIDEANAKLYWVDLSGGGFISRSNLDGSSPENLLTSANGLSTPMGIDIDATNSKLYWIDDGTNKIQKSDLDGSNIEDVLTTGISSPQNLVLDVANSHIYWTEISDDEIKRVDFDGTNVTVINTDIHLPYKIDIDYNNSKLVCTSYGPNLISRIDLDGSNHEVIITGADGVLEGRQVAFDFSDTPLAVELDSFTALQIENSIQLNWTTASETENEGFNVYRRIGNGFYTQIASYIGNSELLGALNSSVSNNYTFVDNSELRNGDTYTYYISDVETNGLETKHEKMAQTVKFTLSEEIAQSKLDYVLAQNFPNPFNPNTTINFQIAKEQSVKLEVYNLKGELVKELVNEKMNRGSHSANWNGTDSFYNQVSSGTYFYKISAGTFTQTNKMILLK